MGGQAAAQGPRGEGGGAGGERLENERNRKAQHN